MGEAKRLMSLAEFERMQGEAHAAARRLSEPHPNGIACPDCGAELWDSSPGKVLASCPPKLNVHCPGCGHRGYRTK